MFCTPKKDEKIAAEFFSHKGIKTVDDLPPAVWRHLRDKLTTSKKSQDRHGGGNSYYDDFFKHKEKDLSAYFAELQEGGASDAFREALGHSKRMIVFVQK